MIHNTAAIRISGVHRLHDLLTLIIVCIRTTDNPEINHQSPMMNLYGLISTSKIFLLKTMCIMVSNATVAGVTMIYPPFAGLTCLDQINLWTLNHLRHLHPLTIGRMPLTGTLNKPRLRSKTLIRKT